MSGSNFAERQLPIETAGPEDAAGVVPEAERVPGAGAENNLDELSFPPAGRQKGPLDPQVLADRIAALNDAVLESQSADLEGRGIFLSRDELLAAVWNELASDSQLPLPKFQSVPPALRDPMRAVFEDPLAFFSFNVPPEKAAAVQALALLLESYDMRAEELQSVQRAAVDEAQYNSANEAVRAEFDSLFAEEFAVLKNYQFNGEPGKLPEFYERLEALKASAADLAEQRSGVESKEAVRRVKLELESEIDALAEQRILEELAVRAEDDGSFVVRASPDGQLELSSERRYGDFAAFFQGPRPEGFERDDILELRQIDRAVTGVRSRQVEEHNRAAAELGAPLEKLRQAGLVPASNIGNPQERRMKVTVGLGEHPGGAAPDEWNLKQLAQAVFGISEPSDVHYAMLAEYNAEHAELFAARFMKSPEQIQLPADIQINIIGSGPGRTIQEAQFRIDAVRLAMAAPLTSEQLEAQDRLRFSRQNELAEGKDLEEVRSEIEKLKNRLSAMGLGLKEAADGGESTLVVEGSRLTGRDIIKQLSPENLLRYSLLPEEEKWLADRKLAEEPFEEVPVGSEFSPEGTELGDLLRELEYAEQRLSEARERRRQEHIRLSAEGIAVDPLSEVERPTAVLLKDYPVDELLAVLVPGEGSSAEYRRERFLEENPQVAELLSAAQSSEASENNAGPPVIERGTRINFKGTAIGETLTFLARADEGVAPVWVPPEARDGLLKREEEVRESELFAELRMDNLAAAEKLVVHADAMEQIASLRGKMGELQAQLGALLDSSEELQAALPEELDRLGSQLTKLEEAYLGGQPDWQDTLKDARKEYELLRLDADTQLGFICHQNGARERAAGNEKEATALLLKAEDLFEAAAARAKQEIGRPGRSAQVRISLLDRFQSLHETLAQIEIEIVAENLQWYRTGEAHFEKPMPEDRIGLHFLEKSRSHYRAIEEAVEELRPQLAKLKLKDGELEELSEGLDQRVAELQVSAAQMDAAIMAQAGSFTEQQKRIAAAAGELLGWRGGSGNWEGDSTGRYNYYSGQRSESEVIDVINTIELEEFSPSQLRSLEARYRKLPAEQQELLLLLLESAVEAAVAADNPSQANVYRQSYRRLTAEAGPEYEARALLLDARVTSGLSDLSIQEAVHLSSRARLAAFEMLDRPAVQKQLEQLREEWAAVAVDEARQKAIFGEMAELQQQLDTQEALIRRTFSEELQYACQAAAVSEQGAVMFTVGAANAVLTGETAPPNYDNREANVETVVMEMRRYELAQIERMERQLAKLDTFHGERVFPYAGAFADASGKTYLRDNPGEDSLSEQEAALLAERRAAMSETLEGRVHLAKRKALIADIERRHKAIMQVEVQSALAYLHIGEAETKTKPILDKLRADYHGTALQKRADKLVRDFDEQYKHDKGDAALRQFLHEANSETMAESIAWQQGGGVAGAIILGAPTAGVGAPLGYLIGNTVGFIALKATLIARGSDRIRQAYNTGYTTVTELETAINASSLILETILTLAPMAGTIKSGPKAALVMLSREAASEYLTQVGVQLGEDIAKEEAVKIARALVLKQVAAEGVKFGDKVGKLGLLMLVAQIAPQIWQIHNADVTDGEKDEMYQKLVTDLIPMLVQIVVIGKLEDMIVNKPLKAGVDLYSLRRTAADVDSAHAEVRKDLAELGVDTPEDDVRLPPRRRGYSVDETRSRETQAWAEQMARNPDDINVLRTPRVHVVDGLSSWGLYDHSTNRILIDSAVPPEQVLTVLAHEMEHARQCQFIIAAHLQGRTLAEGFYRVDPQTGERSLGFDPEMVKAVEQSHLFNNDLAGYWGEKLAEHYGSSNSFAAEFGANGSQSSFDAYHRSLVERTARIAGYLEERQMLAEQLKDLERLPEGQRKAGHAEALARAQRALDELDSKLAEEKQRVVDDVFDDFPLSAALADEAGGVRSGPGPGFGAAPSLGPRPNPLNFEWSLSGLLREFIYEKGPLDSAKVEELLAAARREIGRFKEGETRDARAKAAARSVGQALAERQVDFHWTYQTESGTRYYTTDDGATFVVRPSPEGSFDNPELHILPETQPQMWFVKDRASAVDAMRRLSEGKDASFEFSWMPKEGYVPLELGSMEHFEVSLLGNAVYFDPKVPGAELWFRVGSEIAKVAAPFETHLDQLKHDGKPLVLGRQDTVLTTEGDYHQDRNVSRKHAELTALPPLEDGTQCYRLKNLSKNGTVMGDGYLRYPGESRILYPGDSFVIGKRTFTIPGEPPKAHDPSPTELRQVEFGRRIERLEVDGEPFEIGRQDKGFFDMFWDRTVSRRHAKIEALPPLPDGTPRYLVTNLSKKNNTLANGKVLDSVIPSAVLYPGERIKIGNKDFVIPGEAAADPRAARRSYPPYSFDIDTMIDGRPRDNRIDLFDSGEILAIHGSPDELGSPGTIYEGDLATAELNVGGRRIPVLVRTLSDGRKVHVIQQQAIRSCVHTANAMIGLDLALNHQIFPKDFERFYKSVYDGSLSKNSTSAEVLRRQFGSQIEVGTLELYQIEFTAEHAAAMIAEHGTLSIGIGGEIGGHHILLDAVKITPGLNPGDPPRTVATIRDPHHGWQIDVPFESIRQRLDSEFVDIMWVHPRH